MTIKSITKHTLKALAIISFTAFQNCNNESTEDKGETDPSLIPLSECVDGFAGIYPCKDYDLMSFVSNSTLGGIEAQANDCWGWTDPNTLKEYVLFGTTNGTAFIDISTPNAPVFLGTLPTATENSIWRDIKVYKNFAFIVSEAKEHGMQIFDLTKLRNQTSPQTFTTDARYTQFGSAHNLVVNEDSGYAYAVGTDTFNGGPHIINIQNPATPVFAGSFANDGYTHDAQVVNYKGPDTDYQNHEIYFGSNESHIAIIDVTDKNNPHLISKTDYSNIGYTHQGWLTEDQRFFLLGDETDEWNFGNNTRTLVFDFEDLDHPKLHTEYFGPSTAIDHNGYTKNDTFFQSSYTAGMRAIDIKNIESSNLEEIGFFDTFPENDNTTFNGAWSVYPFFESGNIAISDINRGLFIVRKSK